MELQLSGGLSSLTAAVKQTFSVRFTGSYVTVFNTEFISLDYI